MLEFRPRSAVLARLRTIGGVALVIVGLWIAFSILGFAIHVVWTLVKVAIVAGLVLAGVTLLGGRRDH